MHRRALAVPVFVLLLVLLYSRAQSQQTNTSRAENFRRMSIAAETKGLGEPFKGITTNGTVQTGLFSIKSTGVSTEPVQRAASSFLASLTPEQRKKTEFPV